MSKRPSLATNLFPLGTAAGAAFCNRESERKQLTDNILAGTHTYIIGPRRYGKTSLVEKVIAGLSKRRSPRVHATSIDLFTVHSIESLDALLRDAIGSLTAEFLPTNRKVLGHIGKIFSVFNPELTVRNDGWSVRLFSRNPSPSSLQKLLLALDEAAQKYKRRVVLVMDEFQQIAEIDTEYTIEGAIRHVAQRTKNLTFVYLGSERTTMEAMFGGEARPLFNSGCRRLDLERISANDYEKYLLEASRLQWRKQMSDGAIKKIVELTDCHANYVNVLCRELWRLGRPPSENMVQRTWSDILMRDRHHAHSVLMALSNGQRAALQAFATKPTTEPTAKDYLQEFGIAVSSMRQFLKVLLEKDFVRKRMDNENYEVVDPLIRDLIRLPMRGDE